MREVQERGEKVIRSDVFVAKARKAGLKDRPAAILAFMAGQGRATVAECEKALKEPRRTLQRDLKLLVEKGFAREVSSGPTDPTKYYEPKLCQALTANRDLVSSGPRPSRRASGLFPWSRDRAADRTDANTDAHVAGPRNGFTPIRTCNKKCQDRPTERRVLCFIRAGCSGEVGSLMFGRGEGKNFKPAACP